MSENSTASAILIAVWVAAFFFMGMALVTRGGSPTPTVTVVYDCNTNTGDAPPAVLQLCGRK